MRFGVSGEILPRNMNDFTPDHAARVRALGFTGLFTRFGANDPFTTTRAECQRVRAILADYGLDMVQCTGYWQPLIHPDESVRRQAVRTLQAALRVAGWLGSYAIDTGPGSLSPRGPWFPHPDNHSPRCLEQLIKSLREAVPAAEEAGVIIALEGHQLVCLRSAEVMREVIDAVGSPWVRCDFDPVNWITLDTVFRTGPAIEAMVDILGDRIVSAHAKDIVIEDRLVLHLDQRPAGQGLLDYQTFFRRLEALNPSIYVIVEGASVDELPQVKRFLDETAAALGIRVF